MMKGACPEEGHLKDEQYIGTGRLYNYQLVGIHNIEPTNNPHAVVIGDIYEIDEDTFKEVMRYYCMFGYNSIIKPIAIIRDLGNMNEFSDVDCIVFIKEYENMTISKNEMKIFGSSEPFEWLKECYDILENEFKDIYTDSSDMIHFRTSDIEGFKAEIDQFVKNNPNAKVYASGFVLSTENPEKNQKFEYRKD